MSETFEEWWQSLEDMNLSDGPECALDTWKYQQSKIDRLTERLKKAEAVVEASRIFAKDYYEFTFTGRGKLKNSIEAYDQFVKEGE